MESGTKYDNGGFLVPGAGCAIPVTPQRNPLLPRPVCLTKNCAGDNYEIRTWAGPAIRAVHVCA